jgi:hypothetical protein
VLSFVDIFSLAKCLKIIQEGKGNEGGQRLKNRCIYILFESLSKKEKEMKRVKDSKIDVFIFYLSHRKVVLSRGAL